jgi:hypothetical protein
VKIYQGSTLMASALAGPAGEWSVTRTWSLGSHTIGATATDAALNTGPPSGLRHFTIKLVNTLSPAFTFKEIVHGHSVTLRGVAKPAENHKLVYVQILGRRWTTIGSLREDSHGFLFFSVRPTRVGDFFYRFVIAADAGHMGAVSRSVDIDSD